MLPSWIRLYRLFFGVLAFYAIVWNLLRTENPNFWNLFTNQSSFISGAVLILGALFFPRIKNPAWWDVIRGTAVISMLVTGVVFATLLGGLYNPFATTEHVWASSVMHQLLPMVMLLDILIVPLGGRTKWWTALLYPVYPLLYLGWSLVRGSRIGWYPYDFVNHTTYDNGYIGVTITCGALLIIFLIVGLGIINYSRMRRMPVAEKLI